ncbi:hypothetical protein [Sessilibacter corallicola]|uniref:hypothetical protein n=1 Tax=Sessilibacter corallicola TaxID=2904075 RepID=UPI001E2FE9A0|nr:hypothetical protein [Sessilibacter corallicola]MCE2029938.1 hypothetical protein [Sessilibacter corallicola]
MRKLFYLFFLSVLFLPCIGNAQVQIVQDREYDDSGNTIRIINTVQSEFPSITSFEPEFINAGESFFVTVEGSNFLTAQVVSDDPSIIISEVEAEFFRLSFRVSVSSNVSSGARTIIIRNQLGEVEQSFFVAGPRPELLTFPSPVVLNAESNDESVNLNFSPARPENEIYTISSRDSSIASLDADIVNIAAGGASASIDIIGFQEGVTAIDLVLDEQFFFFSFPVYVSPSFSNFLSNFSDEPDILTGLTESNIFSDSVGVFVGQSAAVSNSSALSDAVGVQVTDQFPALSSLVGINFRSSLSSFSAITESVIGPVIDPFFDNQPQRPLVLQSGDSEIVEVHGVNLSEILSASVLPADGIDINDLSVTNNGSVLSFSLTIEEGASIGLRELILRTQSTTVRTRFGSNLFLDIQ